ncbi:hypothetical protein [Vibrio harveyi]|uniref:hypothetical protein n=1 Tax=Vibrio harveyi TaxID=669 RepID=UPI003CF03BBD
MNKKYDHDFIKKQIQLGFSDHKIMTESGLSRAQFYRIKSSVTGRLLSFNEFSELHEAEKLETKRLAESREFILTELANQAVGRPTLYEKLSVSECGNGFLIEVEDNGKSAKRAFSMKDMASAMFMMIMLNMFDDNQLRKDREARPELINKKKLKNQLGGEMFSGSVSLPDLEQEPDPDEHLPEEDRAKIDLLSGLVPRDGSAKENIERLKDAIRHQENEALLGQADRVCNIIQLGIEGKSAWALSTLSTHYSIGCKSLSGNHEALSDTDIDSVDSNDSVEQSDTISSQSDVSTSIGTGEIDG